jgi:hypothetical protein
MILLSNGIDFLKNGEKCILICDVLAIKGKFLF